MLARTLNLLGADLPADLMGPSEDNSAGFWEPNDLVGIHDEMLVASGFRWHSVGRLRALWEDRNLMAQFYDRIVKSIELNYSGSRLFVLKDPRISRFVPLIVRALRDLGVTPKFLISIRNPLEVAASLSRRDGIHPNMSHLLWLDHYFAAERDTCGFRRSFVFYEEMLKDWPRQLKKVARQLAIEFPGWNPEGEEAVNANIDFRLRHHERSLEGMLADRDGLPWVKSVLKALIVLSDGESDESLERIKGVSLEYDAALVFFGPILSETNIALEEATERAEAAASAVQRDRNERDRMRTAQEEADARTVEAISRIRHLEDELSRMADRAKKAGVERRLYGEKLLLLGQRLKDLEACSAQYLAQSEGRQAQVNERDRHLQVQGGVIEALHEEAAQKDEIIANLLASRSWRATAPLRWMSRKAAGSFRRWPK